MTLADVLILLYASMCVLAGIYLSNRFIDKEKITRGNIVTYIVFFPGFLFGLLTFLLISFLFALIDFIDNHKEKIYTWWDTPIKK